MGATGEPAEGRLASFLGAPAFEVRQVFGGDRFPNVVVAMDGTVLAFWNGVKVRRSEDGGKTWEQEILVGNGFMGGGVTVDETSGNIFVFVESGHPPADLTVYRSEDHGRTWAPFEVEIAPDSRGNTPAMHMNEHGITLRRGAHRGRILRPARWYGRTNNREEWPEHYTTAIYSDDGGANWRTSEPFPAFGTGEAVVAELSDGRIYYNSRRHWAQEGVNLKRRWTAWSGDGGETWENLTLCEALPDGPQNANYGCMAGLVRLPVEGRDILLYSNPDSDRGRERGTVWASFDGGETWPLKRLAEQGGFAYSSLDAGRPGTPSEGWIYLFFEGGGGQVARFNLSWVLEGEQTGDGDVPAWTMRPESGVQAGDLTGKEKVAPAAEIVARPFDLAQVRLLPSRFHQAMELNQKYLLELDPDRLLWPYHERAGLPVKGERYGGWAQRDVVGQISGHYISALALMYESTGDHVFKERLDYMVSEIAKAQEAHGDGYTGPVRTEVWERIAAGDLAAHKWGVGGGYVPWYVMHKTFAGLIDAYLHADNQQALEVVEGLADWAKRVTDNLDETQFQDMLRSEFGGMGESLAQLYALTGNQDYLALAKRFDHQQILEPLAAEEDELTGHHVNTQLPKILSAARLYELTGDARYAIASRFFWDRVVETRSMAQGGVDLREHFFAAGEESEHLAWNSSETCSVHNMLKLTRHLFFWQPSAQYMDYYERALYNQILGSQDPESGGFTYFYSLAPGHFKIYSTPFDAMWCCVGTGIENHAKYADTIYSHNNETLWVNLFIPSELDWKQKGLRIRQETEFPNADTIRLVFSAEASRELDLRIRVPYWATQGVEVSINGERQHVAPRPGTYLALSRNWEDGDRVEVRLPMSLHLRPARDDESMVALMYGPVVLAGELGTSGMRNVVVSNQSAYAEDLAPPVPVLAVDSADPADWMERVPGEMLRFKTVGVGKPVDFTLIPLWEMHRQRYTVYFQTMPAAEWAPPAPLKPSETVAADDLSPGLHYTYYEGRWQNLPDFSEMEPVKTGTVGDFELSMQGERRDHFGVVFSGFIRVDAPGEYYFATKSDDGSRLRLNGEEMVLNDGVHAMIPAYSGPVMLEPGFYPFELEYFEYEGGEGLEVLIYTGEEGWRRIGPDALYRAE